ncbi:malate dehydrogenase [Acropora cervicornis]|uniref:Malate dehydrogenase n=1 Tax=Acropora cervicornis TaxID=6130 RepID=A0AAD9QXV7_ACRCE|nr:malate dehydrogenase [Acropora cervicornis]
MTRVTRMGLCVCGPRSFRSFSTARRLLDEYKCVAVNEAESFIERCMRSVGTPDQHCRALSQALVAGDVRGHFSHGLNRLEMYVHDIEVGTTALEGKPEIVKETTATALVEGNNLLGPVVANFCNEMAMKKAKDTGVGWVACRGSNHYGIAGWYTMKAGMSFTNTSPLIVPTRARECWFLSTIRNYKKAKNKDVFVTVSVVLHGKMFEEETLMPLDNPNTLIIKPLLSLTAAKCLLSNQVTLGTNPLSVAAPGKNGDSFVLDMATSCVALGKIEMAKRKGVEMPHGWGVDSKGQETLDPEKVLSGGGQLPLGGMELTSGFKGYGLAMMVEVFCGILADAAFGPEIRKWKGDERVANLGQCFVAINPSAFAPGFEDRLQMEGETSVLVAGDPERIHMRKVEQDGGISYHINLMDAMDKLADRLNVAPMPTIKE